MNRQQGFTVIEILVAIALTMVVGWLVSMAFNNTSQACRGVTATLDYQAKGEAILNMLSTDINNTCQFAKSESLNTSYAAFKTVLPRQRTRYNSGDLVNRGDYRRNVVSMRWQFNPGDNDKTPTSLYRAVSAADSTAEMTSLDCYNGTAATIFNLAPAPDNSSPLKVDLGKNSGNISISNYLITHTDIRDFKLTTVKEADGASAKTYATLSGATIPGRIPTAYVVSFYLTNAPIKVKSPASASNDAEKIETNKYLWVFFSRTIATR